MSYAILRTAKLKSLASILGSGKHTFREVKTLNSNGAKNLWLTGPTNSSALVKAVQARLPVKRRKSSVLCIEYLITASPSAFKRHGGQLSERSGYFVKAMAWLKGRHGTANVICAAVHLDETSPHLIAYVTPLTEDGRLSARDFLGGAVTMQQMQTDFHEACGKPYELTREIRGSKARHQTLRRYYQALNTDMPHMTRSDLAAAVVGLSTRRYREFQLWARALAAHGSLTHAKQKALYARQEALTLQAQDLHLLRASLDERELQVEERLDRLGDIDAALSAALRDAEMEKERANLLSIQIETMRRLDRDSGKAPEPTGASPSI